MDSFNSSAVLKSFYSLTSNFNALNISIVRANLPYVHDHKSYTSQTSIPKQQKRSKQLIWKCSNSDFSPFMYSTKGECEMPQSLLTIMLMNRSLFAQVWMNEFRHNDTLQ